MRPQPSDPIMLSRIRAANTTPFHIVATQIAGGFTSRRSNALTAIAVPAIDGAKMSRPNTIPRTSSSLSVVTEPANAPLSSTAIPIVDHTARQ